MAEIANTLWYRLGTISVTDGSTKVTGVGTHFTTAGINPGATLRVDGRPYAYEVKRVVSDTELELAAAYYGGTVSSSAYSIDRNFQSTTNAKLAADVTDLVGLYEQVRNGTVTTIEGKSAYQVAVANGYKGTEAQWLESLKGNAEEITAINSKLDRIYTNNSAAHNAVYRGKNLGTSITAAQIAAIKAGTFDDIYPGDFWVINGNTYTVLGCNVYDFVIIDYTVTPNQWMIPRNHIAVDFFKSDVQLHSETDISGGLAGMDIHNVRFPEWTAELEAIFGADNILYKPTYIADAVNSSGKPTHYIQLREKIFVTTTGQMWGLPYENSFYKHHKVQLPFYRFNTMVRTLPNGLWCDVMAEYNKVYIYGTMEQDLEESMSVDSTQYEIKCHFLLG